MSKYLTASIFRQRDKNVIVLYGERKDIETLKRSLAELGIEFEETLSSMCG